MKGTAGRILCATVGSPAPPSHRLARGATDCYVRLMIALLSDTHGNVDAARRALDLLALFDPVSLEVTFIDVPKR